MPDPEAHPLSSSTLPGPALIHPGKASQDQEPFPQQKALVLALAAPPGSVQPDRPHLKSLPEDLGQSLKLAVPILVPTVPLQDPGWQGSC